MYLVNNLLWTSAVVVKPDRGVWRWLCNSIVHFPFGAIALLLFSLNKQWIPRRDDDETTSAHCGNPLVVFVRAPALKACQQTGAFLKQSIAILNKRWAVLTMSCCGCAILFVFRDYQIKVVLERWGKWPDRKSFCGLKTKLLCCVSIGFPFFYLHCRLWYKALFSGNLRLMGGTPAGRRRKSVS